MNDVSALLHNNGIAVNDTYSLTEILNLVKDRCHLLNDFVTQAGYFFKTPVEFDLPSIQKKWSPEKTEFFKSFAEKLNSINNWQEADIEATFKQLAEEKNIKAGELQLPLRIMLVGGKYGPAVFKIAEIIGAEEVRKRIESVLTLL